MVYFMDTLSALTSQLSAPVPVTMLSIRMYVGMIERYHYKTDDHTMQGFPFTLQQGGEGDSRVGFGQIGGEGGY